jgi:hypothetical protein
MANARKKKNYIHSLQAKGRVALTQSTKHDIIYSHFLQHVGTYVPRQCTLNFSELECETRNLDHLDNPFSEDEIRKVVMSAPKEKSPGPDGYIRLFFSSCWHILKEDLIKATQHFYLMNSQGLHLLNQAYVVLVPKKQNATKVGDFRHISLIHSFAKVLSKLLANRLSPELNQPISMNQTAYVK